MPGAAGAGRSDARGGLGGVTSGLGGLGVLVGVRSWQESSVELAVAGSTRGPLRSSGPWVVPRRKMRASSALVVRSADDAGATVEGAADADAGSA